MSKLKQHGRPAKKQKARTAVPESADDYQELADDEEDRAGKWRQGDPPKSARAFVRALEIYDNALQKHSTSFDLAYNKARLQLEITQQPLLVAHIGVPLIELLWQTLASHRFALRLDEQNPDILFNSSQVLTSLAEHLADAHNPTEAVALLHEALELLSACLSRQEMLLEQQHIDFDEAEGGGVPLDSDEELASSQSPSISEQTATIVEPLSPGDLLDTIHASLSALTTLVGLVHQNALQTLGDLAHTLSESKASMYVQRLQHDQQEDARFEVFWRRAVFIAAFADAQFNASLIDLNTYLDRLDGSFDIPNKQRSSTALCSEAEARTECTTSIIAQVGDSGEFPGLLCWNQLTLAQNLYAQTTTIFGHSSQTYLSRGDVDLLRHRLATMSPSQLSEKQRQSASTLAQNAHTFYKNAAKLSGAEDEALRLKAQQRMWVADQLRVLLYKHYPGDNNSEAESSTAIAPASMTAGLEDCLEEGLIDSGVAQEIGKQMLTTKVLIPG